MKFIFLIGIWLMAVKATAQVPPKQKFRLYLLAGQSNMAGRGAVEAEDTVVNSRVWMLTKNNEWKLAKEPLHFDKPGITGVGPGLAFGKAMAADTSIIIGLIPCAVGGTSINFWNEGQYDSITKTHPYDDAIRRTKQAMKDGILKGILWQQGESDSDSLRCKGYDEKLAAVVKRFRKDLGESNLLFVAGTIAEFYVDSHPFAKQINEVIEALPGKIKNAVVVQSSGLIHKGDKTHFDSASARELGRRYAEAVKRFYKMNKN